MIRAGLILWAVGWLLAGWAAAQTTSAPTTATNQAPRYRQAYREGFQPPADASDEMRRMRELIHKINQTSLPEYRPEPIRPAAVTPKSVELADPAATKPKVAAPPKVLSTETLKELTKRVPESVADPIRLGDALYRGGHGDQAMFIYQKALESAENPDDQIWLYYQMGCCLKDAKPAEAKKYYQKVRAAAPDGPWAELANIQLQLVDWMEQNQPTQFLEDLRRDLQPQNDERIESGQTQPRTGENSKPADSGTLGSSKRTAAPQPAKETTPAPAKPETKKPATLSKAPDKQ
jgi:tetratricopeptide (TPR) repeat protein